MTRVNLLPWRETRRQQQQRDFIGLLVGAVVIGALGVAIAHLYVATLIEHQEARNQFLRTEITKLDRFEQEIREMEISEERLRARLESIQELQRQRPELVQVADALVHQLPEDLYLTNIRSAGRNMTLRGNARINNTVSNFMRELGQSPLFGEPNLRVIENKEVVKDIVASQFELVVNRTRPNTEEGEGDAEEVTQ